MNESKSIKSKCNNFKKLIILKQKIYKLIDTFLFEPFNKELKEFLENEISDYIKSSNTFFRHLYTNNQNPITVFLTKNRHLKINHDTANFIYYLNTYIENLFYDLKLYYYINNKEKLNEINLLFSNYKLLKGVIIE